LRLERGARQKRARPASPAPTADNKNAHSAKWEQAASPPQSCTTCCRNTFRRNLDASPQGLFAARSKRSLVGNAKVIRITSDLIVHSRREKLGADNLIAIEMKEIKVWWADGRTHPEHVCGYKLGLFVGLNCRRRTYRIEEFRRGMPLVVSEGRF
jgi:hypothetical protein